MSFYTETHSLLDRVDDQVCEHCGCTFRVKVYKQTAHNEREQYVCPECHKSYYTNASMPPEVTMLKPRTDGRNDKLEIAIK